MLHLLSCVRVICTSLYRCCHQMLPVFFVCSIVVSGVPTAVFAHRDPVVCSGSGLGINLYTNSPQVPIGSVIFYSVEVFNGTSGPTVCTATDITAFVVTPDGVTNPLTLLRTSLAHGEIDTYTDVVSYTASEIDIVAGSLNATASVIGIIHQNDHDSLGGGDQGVNVTIGQAPVLPPPGCCTPPVRRPVISVTKVPSPSALPAPGFVTYTYEVSNPGLYTMNNISLTDDKCSPVNYSSGDTNNDSLLPTNEVWIYTCTTWLVEDTFNTATATGYANGLPATDTAYAIVRVGTQVPPPLIHVVKTPNRLLLPFGGGVINYTYVVSNPGVVALYDVQVTDNKCSPLTYHLGDTDGDKMLDVGETWHYSCKTNIEFTTANTVTATGKANNLTAIDLAFATVVVAPRPKIVPRTIPTPLPEPPEVMPVTGVEMDICEGFAPNLLSRLFFCAYTK